VPDEPAICFCLRQMRLAGLETIVVVLGHNRQAIEPVIADVAVDVAVNPHPHSPMSASVSSGMAALPQDCSGIMLALCDHPLVSATTYATLRKQHMRSPETIVLPVHRGKGGHPTIFPWDLAQAAHEDRPLNQVVRAHPQRVQRLALEDSGLTQDMDTPEDYNQILQLARQGTA